MPNEMFAIRGLHLPDQFATYEGYSDSKKKRSLDFADGLQQHVEQLSGILMQP